MTPRDNGFRKTTQHLMPALHAPTQPGEYDIYPGFDVGAGRVGSGVDALAARIARGQSVVIDGYGGVLWEDLRERLDRSLCAAGVEAAWTCVDSALLPGQEIERMVEPFLGGDDPLFGTRFTGELRDFFVASRLAELRPDPGARLNILYGCGAALANWPGLLVYADVPKNEIQFRSRAESVRNLGTGQPAPPKQQYKRFYFVDWVALNRHKASLVERIDVIVDNQRPDDPAFTDGETLRAALGRMARNVFRVRPWFEPGPWGGQWIAERIRGLSREVPNYAWSFELIVPENGLILESDGRMLEVSFDFLMFLDRRAVLGVGTDRFGFEFPIRYDFLDTFDGGNLSLQCHPRTGYIRRNFGETFTQDETYYLLDCRPGAEVFLGFREGVDPREFRAALDDGFRHGSEVDVRRFVNVEKALKHDLFLIPNGTIHCSGRDNLVLEISATPYIFTFKMYDWMRMDLDGKPRPLNIERAFDNLYFDRQGDKVQRELVSRPRVVREGGDWRLVHLPTHREQFYDVHRFEFGSAVEVETEDSPHVMSLVEGRSVLLETAGGVRQRFSYAETFVIPAGAGSYRLTPEHGGAVKVLKTFLKPEAVS
jgi:mannose-6-phosphate isomerase class I